MYDGYMGVYVYVCWVYGGICGFSWVYGGISGCIIVI